MHVEEQNFDAGKEVIEDEDYTKIECVLEDETNKEGTGNNFEEENSLCKSNSEQMISKTSKVRRAIQSFLYQRPKLRKMS